ncbi:MAG: hypothetical protein ACM3Q4_12910 [Acidobacteriota bacterium]
MRSVDPRVVLIVVLAAAASVLGYCRYVSGPASEAPGLPAFSPPTVPEAPPASRMRSMIDTTLKALGAPKKFVQFRTNRDSGNVPEAVAGVPASFDELRLIRALTDSLASWQCTLSARKSLKEKTTTIRIEDRSHTCMYRLILYRKELSH